MSVAAFVDFFQGEWRLLLVPNTIERCMKHAFHPQTRTSAALA